MRAPSKARLLLVYLCLLGASHLYRHLVADDPRSPLPGQSLAQLHELGRDGTPSGRTIEVAYRDLGSPDDPALVLLHGSPLASRSFDALLPSLQDRGLRLIVPDLPGFGGSTHALPDYSLQSHARYLASLLDHLEIQSAHLLGYSRGGGVAIAFAGVAPQRARSLILLSSVGVRDLELLGDYRLNQALYSLQLVALWLVQEGIPHFGWWDTALPNVPYARSYSDSDRRPLLEVLQRWQNPALVIHGRRDPLVPFSAATDHVRLVPQAEALYLEGGHFLVLLSPGDLAPRILTFVKSGAPSRPDASPDRLAAAAAPFEPRRLDASTAGLVTALVLLALATFVSEDLACLSAGLLVSQGVLGYLPATAGCLLGIVVGDIGLFLIGRWFGIRALHRAPLRWFVDADRAQRARGFFARRGLALVFATRFLPGTRLPTYVGAGLAGAPFLPFLGAFLVSAIVWTPLFVGIAVAIGRAALPAFERYAGAALWVLAALVAFYVLVAHALLPALTCKGRRLLLSRWRRLVRWEFWPPWVFYPPVILFVLWLCLRHRSLTVFTAAAPSIPCGGLVMESKSEILSGLVPSGAVPPFAVLPADPLPTTFPLVLKPDVGERGQGVAVVRDRAEAQAYLASAPSDMRTIAQAFVPGEEFGVFYARLPSEERGRVISLTEKRLLSVTGDGARTLEDLILADDRAVCMARFFLTKHGDALASVPAAGEVVPLTEVGTHCRGALFLDASHHLTPELETAIDQISKSFPGTHFGRYDLRVPSLADLRAGRNLQILELNGVSSEATHIYDPKHGLLYAYRTLFHQWRLCFAIARQNVALGARPATLADLLARLRQFRRKVPFEPPAPSVTSAHRPVAPR
ncbi:hypothetical protein BH23VER1_BH23VER1_11400 [soil metagenome]